MEIAVLTAFLAPFLPFLLKAGEKAAEKAGEQFGEDAWNKAKAVWAKLHPKVEAKAAAQEAVTDVASNPNDEDLQASLRVQLKKILEQDQELARAIAQIMQADAPDGTTGTQIIQTVTGNQNQVIGQVSGGLVFGNVSGTVVTGGAINNPPPKPPVEPFADEPTAVKTILVLTANPRGTHALRLGEEVRKIQAALERSQHRDEFRIKTHWAVTPEDVRRALLEHKPYIVQFSGHGVGTETSAPAPADTRKFTVVADVAETATEPEGLMFEDEMGQPKLVSTAAIAGLFELFKHQLEGVVLNACYSKAQAQAIAEHIPYVVGMSRWIGDAAAIEFAKGFYDAIFAGRSVELAYQLGCNAIQMMGIPEYLTPVLHPEDH